VVIDGERHNLAIVSAGKAYLDVRQALVDLGLDEATCRRLGVRLYKPGLVWPMDPVFGCASLQRPPARYWWWRKSGQ
jgi:TPP-dependent indolepyruvate ferredoxin oxidoreductase alpha subunit